MLSIQELKIKPYIIIIMIIHIYNYNIFKIQIDYNVEEGLEEQVMVMHIIYMTKRQR